MLAKSLCLVAALLLSCTTAFSLKLPPVKKTPKIAFNCKNYVKKIDNPFFPLKPGTTFFYKGTDEGKESIDIFEVTHQTKKILGVTTTVVHDRAFLNGNLVEETFDHFAQDIHGNVWYFGEDTEELKHCKVVSTEGSWRAGVNGAKPGIIMLAHPKVGDVYNQENAPGVAEDKAKVLSLNATVHVPFGTFKNCLKTKDFTPLEPDFVEHKFYAPGIGFVKGVLVKGGEEVTKLVCIRT